MNCASRVQASQSARHARRIRNGSQHGVREIGRIVRLESGHGQCTQAKRGEFVDLVDPAEVGQGSRARLGTRGTGTPSRERDDSSTGSDRSSPRPTLSSELGRPLIVAGFHPIALIASIGAAVDAPPMDALTGPKLDISAP